MFDESKHPRGQPENAGQFVEKSNDTNNGEEEKPYDSKDDFSTLKKRLQKELPKEPWIVKSAETKMTPAEKISSVHIDFSRDNLLPELNEEDLKEIGVDKNKPVLLKKDVIDRNRNEHPDVSKEDMEKIIGEALYSPSNVFSANTEKPNYFHFASFVELSSKGKPKIGITLLDVDIKKDCFEIVHMYYVGLQGLQRAIKKTIKKD